MAWRVRLSKPAATDLRRLLRTSRRNFGPRQAEVYRETILAALAELATGPHPLGFIDRGDIGSGLKTLRVARRGRKGRHLLLYRQVSPDTIAVLRILHDAMDISRHIPPR